MAGIDSLINKLCAHLQFLPKATALKGQSLRELLKMTSSQPKKDDALGLSVQLAVFRIGKESFQNNGPLKGDIEQGDVINNVGKYEGVCQLVIATDWLVWLESGRSGNNCHCPH